MFLRNYWYVAASDDEVRERPLGRTILGEPVVLFRAGNGALHAFEDRCPHRRLPLSMGKSHWRCAAVPLSRPALRRLRQMRARTRSGPHPAKCPRAHLSRGRTLSLDLDLDGRSGAGRPRADLRLPLAGRSGLGRQAVISSCRGQLAAGRRQSPRSHPSRFRSRNHDRQYGAGRARRGQSRSARRTMSW